MDWLLQLDGNILLWIQEYVRNDFLTPTMKFITSLGNGGWLWIALALILCIPKKTRWVGIAAVISLAIGALITNVALKNLVARIRPYEVVDGLKLIIAKPHDFSFPSGHTCASFAAAMVLFKMLPKKWGVPAVVLATLIGLSRLYVGVHYPTDVLGGFIIGCFAAWIAVKIVEWIQKKRDKGTVPVSQ